MKLTLHDTMSGKKLEFKPLDAKKVTMYLCGPTVYNYAHIGNARPAVVFDLLARLLRQQYELLFVRNITLKLCSLCRWGHCLVFVVVI